MGTDRPPPLPARWRPRLTADSLQAGAEPGLFLPGWLLTAARAARPKRGRAARGDDPDLVRDRLVGGLRAADGARPRATTPTPTRRTPVAGSAFASPCNAWRCSAPATRCSSPIRPTPARAGGGRVLDRRLPARGPRRIAWDPPVLRVPIPPP